MDARSLYAQHIATVCDQLSQAMRTAADAGAHYDAIVFHAGSERMYHADDHPVPFHTVPHFARLAPLAGADHVLRFVPGERLRLWRVAPVDYWYEPPTAIDHPYSDEIDETVVATREEAIAKATNGRGNGRTAYVGNSPEFASALGIAEADIEPAKLMAALDWSRAYKTPYEHQCLRDAARVAGLGHVAVRRGFAKVRSEWHLHMDYLAATGLLETEVPYTNIIAWDRMAATLHYQSKSRQAPDDGRVLLIDAGATVWGYASDITRTYANEDCHPVFRRILDAMDDLQLQLVEQVGPGVQYTDIHLAAHHGVARILKDVGVLRVSPEAAFERGLTRVFLPHGVGHHLGLQVHDVGGRQVNPQGEVRPPSPEHPFLRTTRPLEAGHVVTIEPGLYFIPMLLQPLRNGRDADALDWSLIDELIPCGGVRIEDDVLVTSSGRENLSRPFVPGHREPLPKR